MPAPANTTITTDWAVSAGSGLRPQHIALCLLLALSCSDAAIFAELPGLTPGQLQMLRTNKLIITRYEEFRAKYLGEGSTDRFQQYMPQVFEIMSKTLASPEMKLKDRFEAAKWVAEKVTGKARQELEVSGGMTIMNLLTALDGIREERAVSPGGAVLLPGSLRDPGRGHRAAPADPLKEWVATYVTEVSSEKE